MPKVDLRDDLIAARLHTHIDEWFTGNGSQTVFHLKKTPTYLAVFVDGLKKRPSIPGTAYDYSLSGATVTFVTAPANGKNINFAEVSA